MNSVTVEKKIGNTVYVVTSECSKNATETIEQKLERIICSHAVKANNSQSQKLDLCADLLNIVSTEN